MLIFLKIGQMFLIYLGDGCLVLKCAQVLLSCLQRSIVCPQVFSSLDYSQEEFEAWWTHEAFVIYIEKLSLFISHKVQITIVVC